MRLLIFERNSNWFSIFAKVTTKLILPQLFLTAYQPNGLSVILAGWITANAKRQRINRDVVEARFIVNMRPAAVT